MKDRLIEDFLCKTECEKLKQIAEQAKICMSNMKKKYKDSEAVLNSNCARRGIRGGKNTTLNAKLSKSCEVYEESIQLLKDYTKRF